MLAGSVKRSQSVARTTKNHTHTSRFTRLTRRRTHTRTHSRTHALSVLQPTTDVKEAGPGGIFLTLPPQMNQHQYLPTTGEHAADGHRGTWSSNLSYEMGVCYLSGIVGGGTVGVLQGLHQSTGVSNMKLKLNSILNHSGRLGSSTGNSFAIFAMWYSLSRSFIRHQRKENDIYNDIAGVAAAGFLTGLPKSPASALALAGATGGAAALFIFGRQKAAEMVSESAKRDRVSRS